MSIELVLKMFKNDIVSDKRSSVWESSRDRTIRPAYILMTMNAQLLQEKQRDRDDRKLH